MIITYTVYASEGGGWYLSLLDDEGEVTEIWYEEQEVAEEAGRRAAAGQLPLLVV